MKWLSISIFVPTDKWHSLFKEVIQPFVDKLSEEERIYSFYVGFGYLGGEHIRLALLVSKRSAYEVAKYIDGYFKEILSRLNFVELPTDPIYDGIFSPVPQNTIHYGLFSTTTLPKVGSRLALQQAFSKAILTALSEEIVDDDIILTFALYIHFICYKVFPELKHSLLKENFLITKIRQEEYQVQKNSDNDLSDIKYKMLLEGMHEIYEDVMNPSNLEGQSSWIESWQNTFHELLLSTNNRKEGDTLFHYVNLLINQQLVLGGFSSAVFAKFILTRQ